MSVQDQFTAEELARLVAGETITKSLKGGSTTSANKNADKVEEEEAYKPEAYTPRAHIAINSGGKVTKPAIRAKSGEIVNPEEGKVTGWSGDASDRWDQIEADKAEARAEALRLEEADKLIQQQLTPAQILNRLNATQRVVEKLQREVTSQKKEIAALKKEKKQ